MKVSLGLKKVKRRRSTGGERVGGSSMGVTLPLPRGSPEGPGETGGDTQDVWRRSQ